MVKMNNRGHRFGGNWTEQKLDCVSNYLHEYTKIMNNQSFNFAYIDAFAGTGYREMEVDEDTDELLFPDLVSPEVISFRDGSARNYLELKPPFMKYIFIEKDIDRHAELERLKQEYLLKPEFSENMIECENEEANEYLKNLCGKNWRAHRALVFLDPYGMQVEWKTIESIAQTKAIDLWLLFPIGTVNRLLKRNGEIRPSIREKLNLFFGNEQWFEVFYRLAQRIPIFDEDEQWEKTGDIFFEIEQYIMERLQETFAGVAANPLSLRNSKNVPLYLLCFAAGNPKGAPIAVRIAEHVLLKQLREGNLR